MSIVNEVARKSVGPSEADVLSSCLAVTRATVCTAQLTQWPWTEAADIAKAVADENLVLFAEMMVEANVEGILVVHSIWARQIVVNQVRKIGQRIQIREVQARGVEHIWRDYIVLAVVANLVPNQNSSAPIRAGMAMSRKWVKNGA